MRALVLLLTLLALPAMAQTADAPAEDGRTEDVSFDSAEGVTLSGTVSIPDGPGPFPAVVLVSGSGLQDRDGGPDNPLLPPGFRMYRELSDGLRAAGVLVLRYDERGAGSSTAGSDPASVTTLDYAGDAAAAARLLAERDDVRWVGVVGHSEGGLVAPIVANDEPAVDGIVMVAGQGVVGLETVLEQNRGALTAAGVDAAVVDTFVTDLDAVFTALASTAGDPLDDATRDAALAGFEAAFARLPAEEMSKLGLTPEVIPMVVSQQMQAVGSPWFRMFLALDPADSISELDIPALALFFELDMQVPLALNLDPMRAALAESGSPNWAVTTLSGLNHIMQAAETGSASEYARLGTEVDARVVTAIADWVLATAGD